MSLFGGLAAPTSTQNTRVATPLFSSTSGNGPAPIQNRASPAAATNSLFGSSGIVPAGNPSKSPAQPPAKDLRVYSTKALDFSGPILQVCVGEAPKDKIFCIHQHLFTSRAEFFKRATNGKWLESDEGLIYFPNDTPDTFERYINLVYTGQLATIPFSSGPDNEEFMRLTELYVLAERLQDTQAKNDIVDAILMKSRTTAPSSSYPPMSAVGCLYSGTSEGNQARKLFVDMYFDRAKANCLPRYEATPPEFSYDLLARLLKHRALPISPTTTSCPLSTYHEPAEVQKQIAENAATPVGE